jgi:hypothetical protein
VPLAGVGCPTPSGYVPSSHLRESLEKGRHRRENDLMFYLLPNLTFDDSIFVNASKRFIKAFEVAWQRIPEDARKVIMDYLALHPGHVHLCFRMDFGDPPVEPLGRCSKCGNETVFTFLAPYIQHADELEGVLAVIAHELAHCHNHCAGTWTSNEQEEERNTRRLAESWGFYPSPIPSDEFTAEIERWRARRELEFGQHTEKRLFGVS